MNTIKNYCNRYYIKNYFANVLYIDFFCGDGVEGEKKAIYTIERSNITEAIIYSLFSMITTFLRLDTI